MHALTTNAEFLTSPDPLHSEASIGFEI